MGRVLYDSPGGILSLRLVHTESAAIHQLQFQFVYPGPGCLCGFCSCNPTWTLCVHLLSLPSLLCFFHSRRDPRIVADFSVCSAFYLMLRWSGNSQALYMRNWKQKVQALFLKVKAQEQTKCLEIGDSTKTVLQPYTFIISHQNKV